MKFIACIDKFGGLGNNGNLLFNIRKDMKRFKALTLGGVVIMGYTTYKSLPHGVLPERLNIVMTRKHSIENKNVVAIHSKEELFQYLKRHRLNCDDVWIIGGRTLYVDFLPECKEIYLTRVDALRESDCYFPCPEMISGWEQVSLEPNEENGLKFCFEHYIRIR